MLLLIFLVTFGSVSFGAWEVLRPKEDAVARRIGLATSPLLTHERRLQGGLGRRVFGPGAARAGSALARLLPQNWVRHVAHMLVMANEPWSLAGFLFAWALSVILGILTLVYVITSADGITGTQVFTFTVLILPLSVLIPYAVLRRRVKSRQKALIRSLPNGLDLLVTCVEAGVGVDSAFAMVTEKSEGPLAETFALYLRQVGLGRPRREALSHVAERSGVADLLSLAAAVTQAEELGTTLGDVLRVQAAELRMARRHRAETAAQRIPVLMTIPIATCFLPAMGAVVIVPSILNLVDFVGQVGAK
jgi:tight adherence protein C